MCTTYIPALKLKEEKALKAEFKNEFVGVYHDGTTHNGESFAIVYRACKPGFQFRISCVRVRFLAGSMTASQISAVLLDCCVAFMQVHARILFVPSLAAWRTHICTYIHIPAHLLYVCMYICIFACFAGRLPFLTCWHG